jgi:AcrR family transcriptional regulator
MPRSRNAELNEANVQAIKDAARQLMGEQGTDGLSVRGIAKVMGITPPAFYHYYASLDALITALITDNFNALADALEAARATVPDSDPAGQLAAVLLAYRAWAVAHPVDFQLIYGNPIPGYVAPREVTVPAVVRGFSVIVGLIETLLQSGLVTPQPPYDQIDEPVFQQHIRETIAQDGYPISEMAYYLGIVGWSRLHGIIMLEIYHHLQPVVGDVEAHYRTQMHKMLRSFGVKF